jgi:hypothetical protein
MVTDLIMREVQSGEVPESLQLVTTWGDILDHVIAKVQYLQVVKTLKAFYHLDLVVRQVDILQLGQVVQIRDPIDPVLLYI